MPGSFVAQRWRQLVWLQVALASMWCSNTEADLMASLHRTEGRHSLQVKAAQGRSISSERELPSGPTLQCIISDLTHFQRAILLPRPKWERLPPIVAEIPIKSQSAVCSKNYWSFQRVWAVPGCSVCLTLYTSISDLFGDNDSFAPCPSALWVLV